MTQPQRNVVVLPINTIADLPSLPDDTLQRCTICEVQNSPVAYYLAVVAGVQVWRPFVEATVGLIGTADNRPGAASVVGGVTYYTVDQGITYQSDGAAAWTIVANPGLTDQQFYVDSAMGNDANVGTATHPFATLPKAVETLSPTPHGKSRINLIGAGPYTVPSQLSGVMPEGQRGQCLIVCGGFAP